jgi:transcriptional regulator with XRE-family HTH domain
MYGPAVSRRLIGRALRTAREARGLSQVQLGALIGCSHTKVAHMESGRNAPDLLTLKTLTGIFRFSKTEHDRLEELRVAATQRAWYATMRVSERTREYLGLETEADTLHCVEVSDILPGVVQCERYVRRLHALGGGGDSGELDRRVAVRLYRQQRLLGPDPLRLSAVVTMGALKRCAHDHPCVAAEQFAHLLERAQLPNVELLVLPFGTGLHGARSGFSVMTFPLDALPPQAWAESADGGHVVSDPERVAALDKLYDELRGQCLPAEETLALLRGFTTKHPTREVTNHGTADAAVPVPQV